MENATSRSLETLKNNPRGTLMIKLICMVLIRLNSIAQISTYLVHNLIYSEGRSTVLIISIIPESLLLQPPDGIFD